MAAKEAQLVERAFDLLDARREERLRLEARRHAAVREELERELKPFYDAHAQARSAAGLPGTPGGADAELMAVLQALATASIDLDTVTKVVARLHDVDEADVAATAPLGASRRCS